MCMTNYDVITNSLLDVYNRNTITAMINTI